MNTLTKILIKMIIEIFTASSRKLSNSVLFITCVFLTTTFQSRTPLVCIDLCLQSIFFVPTRYTLPLENICCNGFLSESIILKLDL